MIEQLGLVVMSYFIGSIPTGYWLGLRWKGVDVRKFGSGNLGATNVYRVLGAKAGIATLAFDIFKGWACVAIALYNYPDEVLVAIAAGLAAVLGHATSPFVRFRGGKGVATAGGIFLALLPIPTLAAILTFIIVFGATRYVSLGSLTAAFVLAVTSFLTAADAPLCWTAVAVAAFVVWTHRANIQRLRNGSENRIEWGKHAL